ncbi:hypothetical protein AC579_1573 [Pseudocercospora musae]|uniref:fumarylacetoacetase n=1 Tax=Pseudocercospora musae TaxID=113226 RepID=A0A139I1Z5_9PEZI|nr:hypothetical protein AC579_1573 [Pseudocercospora musae]
MSAPTLDRPPFTIHNLPYGVVSTAKEASPRCAVAIGDHAIDLVQYASTGKLDKIQSGHERFSKIFAQSTLNQFASLSWEARKAVRKQLQEDLQAGSVPTTCLIPLSETKQHLPMHMGGFSDFYTSLDHCKNCSGELTSAHIFKNWYYAPSVYNSRVSSVLPSPRDIRRPKNVAFSGGLDSEPKYGPCQKLDFELEMGFFVSKPVEFGETLPIDQVKEHIFGFVMLNDWSARDHQLFEMRPLGPFHSKGFGTSISNWIVPLEALEPFSCPPQLTQDPTPFPHLTWPSNDDGALDIKLKIKLVRDGTESVLGTSNLKYLYWTPYQQLVHHAASGCGMQTGDLIGTGTISGSGRNEKGEMAELGCLYEAERTKTQVMAQVSSAYQPGYLEDGDEIILEGWCEDGKGNVVLGFGDCRVTQYTNRLATCYSEVAMENGKDRQKKWRLSLLTAAATVLLTVIAYFFFASDIHFDQAWSQDELDAGIEPSVKLDLGHGPVVHSSPDDDDYDDDDASVNLHPEQHGSREPRTMELEWNVTKAVIRPDGVAKEVFLVNGAFPGPTIESRTGDELTIVVRNHLANSTDDLSIHWHGIHVNNDMDGVSGISQCGIMSGSNFTYRFNVSNPGTYWWYGEQRSEGLFGALIVHEPASSDSNDYGLEQILLVGDWYHQPAKHLLKEYQAFGVEPSPDSMLINGQGYFPCSMALPNRPVDCEDGKKPYLSIKGRSRLRIINAGTLAGISVSMSGYTMTLLEVEGGQVVDRVSSNGLGVLYPGERVDIIVERREDQTSAWITITLDREHPNLEQHFSISDDISASDTPSANTKAEAIQVSWIDLAAINATSTTRAEAADQTIVLYTNISQSPRGSFNNISWTPASKGPSLPLLALARPTDPAPLIVSVQEGQWIDLIVHNEDGEGHSFHLQGHSFYVLHVKRAEKSLDLRRPLRKDTIYVPSEGYAVLRFKAENVGLWLLRCSVLLHQAIGLNMVIHVQPVDESAWGALRGNAEAQCRKNP